MGLLKEADYEKEIYLADEVIHTGIDEELLTGIRKESKITDLLYGIFTSGSTGIPKGIVVSQKAVVDFISHFVEIFRINEEDRIGNQAPFDFDVSVKDIYSAVMTGAALVLVPKKLFCSPAILLDYLCDKKVTNLTWAVSALTLISSLKGLSYKVPKDVKRVMFSGEVMPVKQLNYWKKYLPNLKTIANVYGPTEATVNCTYYIVDREFSDSEVLPLGKACENTGLLVLDEDNNIIDSSKVNELGELCVYGSSLSAGYWDDEEKTKEKYIDNPTNPYYKEKMYLTGDLVYYNERGELVFAGRKDFQIKHSGYRIELGEIESAAMGEQRVSVVCASYDKKEKQIVLFYQGDIDEESLKEYLLTIIPKYMVPTVYISLKKFPYNDNGKIDRKKLEKDYLS